VTRTILKHQGLWFEQRKFKSLEQYQKTMAKLNQKMDELVEGKLIGVMVEGRMRLIAEGRKVADRQVMTPWNLTRRNDAARARGEAVVPFEREAPEI
jgi:hypothetical protein